MNFGSRILADSLVQAVSQIDLGEPYYVALSEFHDRFVAVEGTETRVAMLADEPRLSSIGIDSTREFLSDAMREYLTFSSPAEFASRNIFTEERPLRRARGLQST
jgi:hypothetical protein